MLATLEKNLITMEIRREVLQKSNIAPNNPQYKGVVYEIDALSRKLEEIDTGVRKEKRLESNSPVYDALEQTPAGAAGTPAEDAPSSPSAPLCTDKTRCDAIGIAWSQDGTTWAAEASTTLRVQLGGNHPCGQIRTALGIVPEPGQCRGCYSVLWTGFSNVSNTMKPSGWEPVCQAVIRNTNE